MEMVAPTIVVVMCKKVAMSFEFFRECVYIMHIKHLKYKDMGKGILLKL